jgi:formylglycine-generating enzyme required for sulfatase activity
LLFLLFLRNIHKNKWGLVEAEAMETVQKIRVFLSSPGDVGAERVKVYDVVKQFDRWFGDIYKITLEVIDWKTHVAPDMGRPQQVINDQIEKYDLFIGIMWKRFGTPTGEAESGTEEEFNIAYGNWKQFQRPRIAFYFSKAPYSLTTLDEIEQCGEVIKFKTSYWQKGLFAEYATLEEFENLLGDHLVLILKQWFAPKTRGALKSPSYADLKLMNGRTSDADFERLDLIKQENRYLDFIISENEKLAFYGFETSVRVPVLLWDVYVPLRANLAGLGRDPFGREQQDKLPEERQVSVEEALQLATKKHYDGLIILGDPGSGKTTLLKYFLLCFGKKEAAQRLNLPDDLLPLLLPLRNVDLKDTLCNALFKQFKGYDLDLSKELFRDRLENGRAILLLDGLDEVADEKTRVEMCRWIDKLHHTFSKCPLIVTSRFSGYRGDVRLPGHYLELNMLDFTKDDIIRFLHGWYTAVEITQHEDNNLWRTCAQNAADELTKRLEDNADYLKLAVNPLMLQLIALVHYDFKTVPDRRVELYEKCVDLLLQKWDEAKGLKMLLSAKEARQVLQPLALWLHSEENRRQATKEELLQQMTPHVQQVKPGMDAEKVLVSMRDRCGVFVGYGAEIYGFQHLSFQEYLTAEEIRNKDKVDELVRHFDESWWREPTLLALGLGNPSIFSSFMRKFLISDKNNGAGADFYQRCLREALVKDEAPLIEVLVDGRIDWRKKYNALLGLQLIASETARAAVKQAAADPNLQLADQALQILRRIGETVAIELDAATGLPRRFFNPLEKKAEYILIPGGTYVMGSLNKKVAMKPFYLAKFTVTNRLYRLFVQSTKHREPEYWDNKRFNADDQPVVGVDWDDANAYCAWLTKANPAGHQFRLPTEAEWEWAAGRGQRLYPWGNDELTPERANYAGKVGQTTPMGSYPLGATPDGLMDLAGNVWEWCADKYDETHEWRVLRGGSWNYVIEESFRCAIRNGSNPSSRSIIIGFRVARSA